jgi:hypothetical protein
VVVVPGFAVGGQHAFVFGGFAHGWENKKPGYGIPVM